MLIRLLPQQLNLIIYPSPLQRAVCIMWNIQVFKRMQLPEGSLGEIETLQSYSLWKQYLRISNRMFSVLSREKILTKIQTLGKGTAAHCSAGHTPCGDYTHIHMVVPPGTEHTGHV